MQRKELETKLEMEKVLNERELLIRDKQLKSVQSMQEVNLYKHIITRKILLLICDI